MTLSLPSKANDRQTHRRQNEGRHNKGRHNRPGHHHVVTLPCVLCLVTALLQSGCFRNSWDRAKHASRDRGSVVESRARELLSRADGACFARVVSVIEKNEMPSDGDHFQEVWIDPIRSTGNVPQFIRVVIQHGGNMPVEAWQELEETKNRRLIRPGSLQPNSNHWFIFSDAFDSSLYPYRVAGWWPDRDDSVPKSVVKVIDEDHFVEPRKWDKTLDLVATWSNQSDLCRLVLRSVKSDDTLAQIDVAGSVEKVQYFHHPFSYEMDWPEDGELHLIHVETRCTLEAQNPFELPPKKYRIHYAFDAQSGDKIAEWVAVDQEIWLMVLFRQYEPSSGKLIQSISFDLLSEGGRSAGSDNEHWYRKTVTRFENEQQTKVAHFRHEFIKTGEEPVYSSTGWLPVLESYAPPAIERSRPKD